MVPFAILFLLFGHLAYAHYYSTRNHVSLPSYLPSSIFASGPFTGTRLNISTITADAATTTTITQGYNVITTVLPVFYCSTGEHCSGFNAQVVWPATITGNPGLIYPPTWATQVLSVGCDGSVYQVNNPTGSAAPVYCSGSGYSSPTSTPSSTSYSSSSYSPKPSSL
jgi:hypothetical protein